MSSKVAWDLLVYRLKVYITGDYMLNRKTILALLFFTMMGFSKGSLAMGDYLAIMQDVPERLHLTPQQLYELAKYPGAYAAWQAQVTAAKAAAAGTGAAGAGAGQTLLAVGTRVLVPLAIAYAVGKVGAYAITTYATNKSDEADRVRNIELAKSTIDRINRIRQKLHRLVAEKGRIGERGKTGYETVEFDSQADTDEFTSLMDNLMYHYYPTAYDQVMNAGLQWNFDYVPPTDEAIRQRDRIAVEQRALERERREREGRLGIRPTEEGYPHRDLARTGTEETTHGASAPDISSRPVVGE